MDEGRLNSLLERIAVGVEKMGADPVVEIETGPPLCPTCGTINPKVQLPPSDGGWGFLGEIMIEALCECGGSVYVVIESYSCHRVRVQAIEEARARLSEWRTENDEQDS
jgi:hypothetical protein